MVVCHFILILHFRVRSPSRPMHMHTRPYPHLCLHVCLRPAHRIRDYIPRDCLAPAVNRLAADGSTHISSQSVDFARTVMDIVGPPDSGPLLLLPSDPSFLLPSEPSSHEQGQGQEQELDWIGAGGTHSAEKAKEKASGEVRFPRLRLSSFSPTWTTGRRDQNCNRYHHRRLPYHHHNYYYVTTSVRIRTTCTSPIHAGPELSTNSEGIAGAAYTTLISQPSQTESY
jgi:hypothetical protein